MKKLIAGISSALLIFVLLVAVAPVSAEGGCDVTVLDTEPAGSIQLAVDAASSGDKICLSGTFSDELTVTIGTSGITLKSASSAILDGGDGPAFRLSDGVSNVTIEGLEIKKRTGFRGGGIEAWDRSTSNITIRNNTMEGNSYNGVLVGSEGGFIHTNWMVKDNTANNNGFAGIELTNCENCTIINNDVDGGYIGIIVQARNSVAGSGLVTINGVNVLHNIIDGADGYGIYVLSFTGHPTNFSPITDASSLLTSVNLSQNVVNNNSGGGILFWAYNKAATAINGRIMHNDIGCQASTPGIRVLERSSLGQQGTVENVKVVANAFDSCDPIIDEGEDTKIPPGPFGL